MGMFATLLEEEQQATKPQGIFHDLISKEPPAKKRHIDKLFDEFMYGTGPKVDRDLVKEARIADFDKWASPDWKSSIPDEKDWYYSKKEQAANIADFERSRYRTRNGVSQRLSPEQREELARQGLTPSEPGPTAYLHHGPANYPGREDYIRSGAKPIGAKENLMRGNFWEKLPFSPAKAAELLGVWDAVKRLNSDDFSWYSEKYGYDEAKGKLRDQRVVSEFFNAMQEQSVRGKTFMAEVGSGVAELPAWMIEFWVTGGLAKLGSKAATKAGMKFMSKYVKTVAGRKALKMALRVGAATVITPTIRTLQQPHRVTEGAIENMIQGDGTVEAWLKAGVANNIENWSEEMGGYITKGLRKAPGTKQVMGIWDDFVKQRFIAKGGTAAAYAKIIKKGGYDGLIGEFGEEWVGGMSQALLGTETYGAEQTGDFLKDTQARLIAGAKALAKQTPSMATTLSVPGLLGGSVNMASRMRGKYLDYNYPGRLDIADQGKFKDQAMTEQGADMVMALAPQVAHDIARKIQPSRKDLLNLGVKGWTADEREAFAEKLRGAARRQKDTGYAERQRELIQEEVTFAQRMQETDPAELTRLAETGDPYAQYEIDRRRKGYQQADPLSMQRYAEENIRAKADQDIQQDIPGEPQGAGRAGVTTGRVETEVDETIPDETKPPKTETEVPKDEATAKASQVSRRQAYQNYREAMPDATDEEIVSAMIKDGIEPPPENLEPFKHLPAVQNVLADQDTKRKAAKVRAESKAAATEKQTIKLDSLAGKIPENLETKTNEQLLSLMKRTRHSTVETAAGKVLRSRGFWVLNGKLEPVEVEPEKEIEHEQEAITEPTPSPEVDQGETGKPVAENTPTGKLDPTDLGQAIEITKLHAAWVAGGSKYDLRNVWEGVHGRKWNAKEGKYEPGEVEYTPEQVDAAYRLVQKPIPSPMADVNLFAMPGKEAQLQAIAEKMRRQKPQKKKKGRLAKPKPLPKAKTKKTDHIKAVYVATSGDVTESRYGINGIFVEGDNLVATDGRRMFIAEGKWGKDGIYLDKTSLKNGVLGKTDKTGAKFPHWQDIVPYVSSRDAIIVEDFSKVWRHVHQAALMANEDSAGLVILANKDGSLGFATASPEVGHSEVNVWPGAEILGAVNPQFLIDSIAFHAKRGNESFEFYFQHPERPILTRSSDGKTSTVIMPVNVGEPSEAIKEATGGTEQPQKEQDAFAADIEKLYEEALSQPDSKRAVEYGQVTPEMANRIKDATGRDVSGYSLQINSDAIRHIHKKHGDQGAEEGRGQFVIGLGEIESIPQMVEGFDSVAVEKTGEGQDAFVFTKRMNGKSVVITVIGTKKERLSVRSMRILKNGRSLNAAQGNPELDVQNATGSIDNIRQKKGKVKSEGEKQQKKRGRKPTEPVTEEKADEVTEADYEEVDLDSDGASGAFVNQYAAERPEPGTNPTPPAERNTADNAVFNVIDLVKLARDLNAGKYPKIVAKIKAARGEALGIFQHDKKTGRIKLKADIFIGPAIKVVVTRSNKADAVIEQLLYIFEQQGMKRDDISVRKEREGVGKTRITFYKKDPNYAASILAHEIGHLVDWVPDKMVKGRGNILGRIASLKNFTKHQLEAYPGGPGPLSKKEKARLKRLAKKMLSGSYEIEVDEYIEKTFGIKPEDVVAVLNTIASEMHKVDPKLHKFIAEADRKLKKSIFVEAMRGKLHESLKGFGKTVREKTGRKIKQTIEQDSSPEAIAAKYRELFEEEIKKRMLLDRETIMEELQKLTKWWNPFNEYKSAKYTAYRYSSPELYAEAMSVLLNNPRALRDKAPEFYRAFFGWLSNKPEMEEAYNAIIDEIKAGNSVEGGAVRLREGFRQAEKAHANARKKRGLKVFDLLKNTFRIGLLDRAAAVKTAARPLTKGGDVRAEHDPGLAIDRATYSNSEHEAYLAQIKWNVVKVLGDVNLTAEDLNEYLFHQRVINDRGEFANPQGFTPKTSKLRLGEMRSMWGPEKWDALLKAQKAFWKIRETMVVAKVRRSGVFNRELADKIADNEHYATFEVAAYIDKKHGKGSGLKIYRQIGTLAPIAGPFEATLHKDMQLMAAINWNDAKRLTVDMLLDHSPESIRKPATVYNRLTQPETDPDNPDRRLVLVMRDSKVVPYYIDKWMNEAFQREADGVIRGVSLVLRSLATPVKALFTGINPGFWTFNVVRDFNRAALNLPGAGKLIGKDKKHIWSFLNQYRKSIGPAFRSVYGIPDSVVEEMLKGNMLISVADYGGHTAEDTRLERLLTMYTGVSRKKWNNNITKPFRAMFHHFLRLGEAIERIPKIAGYKYLKEAFPDMPDVMIEDMVRTKVGSPSFLTKGKITPITNSIFLFSNPMIQAWRSDIDIWKERPGEKAWNTVKFTLLPKAAAWALRAGVITALMMWLYDDDEEATPVKLAMAYEDMFKGISEYDLSNYHCIPIGMTPEGKTVYIRMPLDENQRFIGGLFWKMMNVQQQKLGTIPMLFDYTADQMPGLNPVYGVSMAAFEYLNGTNPYDTFRDRKAIEENLFKAQTRETHIAFGKWAANQLGGPIIYRFKTSDMDSVRTELSNVAGFDFETPVSVPGLTTARTAPVVGNIVGRWIKVSDRGNAEAMQRISADEQKENARVNVQIRKIADKMRKSKDLTSAEQALADEYPEKLKKRSSYVKSKAGNAYERSLLYADTTKERHRLQLEIAKREGPDFDLIPYIEKDIVTMADKLARTIPAKRVDRQKYLADREEALKWMKDRNVTAEDVVKLYVPHVKKSIKTLKARGEKMTRLRRAIRQL